MSVKYERIEKHRARIIQYPLNGSQNVLLKYVSVTKVKVTTDLSLATIWYTIMGDENEIQATKKALEEAKGYLRTELAQRLICARRRNFVSNTTNRSNTATESKNSGRNQKNKTKKHNRLSP